MSVTLPVVAPRSTEQYSRYTMKLARLARAAHPSPMVPPVAIKCEWHLQHGKSGQGQSDLFLVFRCLLDGLMMAGVLPGDGYSVLRVIEHTFSEPDKHTPHVFVVLQTFGDHQ